LTINLLQAFPEPFGVDLSGQFDADLLETLFGLPQFANQHRAVLVLAFGEATELDQVLPKTGIGELIRSYATIANRDGKLKLCCVPPKVMKLLLM